MGFFPASAFAPGFDINGNSVASTSVPQIPTKLETYSYPPFSLEVAQHRSPSNGLEFDPGTTVDSTPSPETPAAYGSTIFDGIMPVFSEFSTDPQAPSSLDDFMMDLMPDMGAAGDNDQQWRSFLADSGILMAPFK